jgi:hypothetical protein
MIEFRDTFALLRLKTVTFEIKGEEKNMFALQMQI